MKKIILLSAILFGFSNLNTIAKHGPKIHRIDVMINQCYNQNPTPLGIITCEVNGYKMWYEEMEKAYDELMTLLKIKDKEILKTNQIEWDKVRKSTFNLNEEIYDDKQILLVASSKTDFVRRRAKELLGYIDFIQHKNEKKN